MHTWINILYNKKGVCIYVCVLEVILPCFITHLNMSGSLCELSEELVTQEKQKKGWRMNCDVGEATEGLENDLWRR